MATIIVRMLRIASFVMCVTVIASFTLFVANQAKSASGTQQLSIAAVSSGGTQQVVPASSTKPRISTVHRAIDQASETFTAPFSSLVPASAGEWAQRGVELLLALALYGFGLGYLAKVLSVRV